jgi:hypothetical protein
MRKLKYPQRMSLSNWTRTEKKLLSERVFRWCKKNMGINRRYKIPISLSVVRNDYEPRTYGAFDPDKNQIILYHNKIRTLQKLVTTIIHEYQHSLQPVKTKYAVYSIFYGYWNNPLEKDARNAEKKHYKKVIDYLNKQ